MHGAWPPSSIVTFFIAAPALAARSLPTGVDPVKETLRMTSEFIIAWEINWDELLPIERSGSIAPQLLKISCSRRDFDAGLLQRFPLLFCQDPSYCINIAPQAVSNFLEDCRAIYG